MANSSCKDWIAAFSAATSGVVNADSSKEAGTSTTGAAANAASICFTLGDEIDDVGSTAAAAKAAARSI